MNNPPRLESERAAAARLTDALNLNICRATVRRLKAKGIDLLDVEAVRHALAMQERTPRRFGCEPTNGPKPNGPKPNQDHPSLSASELDQRLASLESELLRAEDYAEARKIRIQISGFRELVRIQKDRGQLVDRAQVTAEGYEAGLLFKHALMRIPSELLPKIMGLDYPSAVDISEEWIHQLLTDLHELTEKHIVTILKEMGGLEAANRRTNLIAQRNEIA